MERNLELERLQHLLTVIGLLDSAVREIELAIEILHEESDLYYENNDNRRGNICYDAKGILALDLTRLKERRDYLVRVLATKDN